MNFGRDPTDFSPIEKVAQAAHRDYIYSLSLHLSENSFQHL
jgi:hypothetical protein